MECKGECKMCPQSQPFFLPKTRRKLESRFLHKSPLLWVFLFFLITINSLTFSTAQEGETIEDKMKKFLQSHCTRQNQTLEQEEFDIFIRCNPTQAAMIIRDINSHSSTSDESGVRREIESQCGDWPTKKTCQKKNFKLIEKCFDGQQKFVFYFLLALTDTICGDSNQFTAFWKSGGSKCLEDRLPMLTKEISECLSSTSTVTKEELDANLYKITSCIGDKFSDCRKFTMSEDADVLKNLLQSLETSYTDINSQSAQNDSSRLLSSSSVHIVWQLGLLIVVRHIFMNHR